MEMKIKGSVKLLLEIKPRLNSLQRNKFIDVFLISRYTLRSVIIIS